jgi:hypothetical protein
MELDPATSPAVLDTATWDPAAARARILGCRDAWPSVHEAGLRGSASRADDRLPAVSSIVARDGEVVFLAGFPDSQRVFIRVGPTREDGPLGRPFLRLPLAGGLELAAFPSDAPVIDAFCGTLNPPNAPRALGRAPRLGIGSRMTTRLWPGAFAAMERGGFAANPIQNSVRELNLLDDLRRGSPPERNYASGFGTIESGYTGSTFEGLWVEGVLAALAHSGRLVYGADADHIQLKRADQRLEHALRVVEAARYYSFFTLDAADVLSYGAIGQRGSGAEFARAAIPDERERRDVLSFHAEPRRVGGRTMALEADTIGRCIGKYWAGLGAAAALVGRICDLKGGTPFDLELAIDEHPPEIAGPACITSDEELYFVAREVARRGMPVTHLAPNFGVEKGFDYRLADGVDGLERRVAAQHRLASELGFLLDVHSADDLSAASRRAIGRATGGAVHFKVSPSLHLLFAETVADGAPEVFREWWDDALAYARREAAAGSRFAAECVAAWESGPACPPAPSHEVFRHFFFAYPGRRDGEGRFIHRKRLYTLPEDLYRIYQHRVSEFLRACAEDLFV